MKSSYAKFELCKIEIFFFIEGSNFIFYLTEKYEKSRATINQIKKYMHLAENLRSHFKN